MLLQVLGKPRIPDGLACIGPYRVRILVGKNGLIEAERKREGDGCTPLGTMQILYGFYRPDRVANPLESGIGQHLPWLPLTPQLGWCDAPHNPAYNSLVPVGYPASHERLWREDSAYDRLLVTSYNTPAAPGRGSAIFIHQWRENAGHTEGCLAFQPHHLDEILKLGVRQVQVGLAACGD